MHHVICSERSTQPEIRKKSKINSDNFDLLYVSLLLASADSVPEVSNWALLGSVKVDAHLCRVG